MSDDLTPEQLKQLLIYFNPIHDGVDLPVFVCRLTRKALEEVQRSRTKPVGWFRRKSRGIAAHAAEGHHVG